MRSVKTTTHCNYIYITLINISQLFSFKMIKPFYFLASHYKIHPIKIWFISTCNFSHRHKTLNFTHLAASRIHCLDNSLYVCSLSINNSGFLLKIRAITVGNIEHRSHKRIYTNIFTSVHQFDGSMWMIKKTSYLAISAAICRTQQTRKSITLIKYKLYVFLQTNIKFVWSEHTQRSPTPKRNKPYCNVNI